MKSKQPTPVGKEAETKTTTRRRCLKGTLGAAATIGAIPVLSDVAAAHFPLELEIDVQPENAENFIDVSEHESVSVAVHPSEFINSDGERETFDPTDEPVRYRFGSRSTVEDGAGAQPDDDGEVREFDGHNGGSHEALVLTFPVDEMEFDGGEETAWLYWERDDSGEHGYAGMDSVSIYGTETTDQDLLDLLRRLLSQRTSSPER